MNFIIISDFFLSDLPFNGGAEYNDKVLFEELSSKVKKVDMVKSHEATVEFLEKLDKKSKIIISNFINLPESSKKYLIENLDYVLYEHDHKYIKSRNPALFHDFKAPKEQIINYDFYKNAKAVFAQTDFHKKIIDQNLQTNNVINLSGNLWSDEDLECIEKNLEIEKEDLCSILDSHQRNKNTKGAYDYCQKNNIPHELILDKNYHNFLKKIGKNNKFIFLPTTPETLSRICAEARMMGCSVITNGLVGCKHEKWFKMKGKELIEYMRSSRQRIVNLLLEVFDGEEDKEITVILNSYRRPYNLKMQIEAIRNQTVKPKQIWLWVNHHEDNDGFDYSELGIDRIFLNDHNWKFYGRFAAALLSDTKYIAIFDDDTVPGERWFENCFETMKTKQGILGSAGVILNSKIYTDHRRSGWAARNEETERVDLVGHAWFFKREWLQYLWKEKPPTWDNGEDIQFSYAAQRYGNVQTYCPPHPPSDKSLHGSILGNELGIDSKATSNNNQVSHQQFFSERDMCVQSAIKNGWDTVKSVKL